MSEPKKGSVEGAIAALRFKGFQAEADSVETLRARLSRQQEWIDAVMGQGSWYAPCDNETVLVIIRPQPLAKE